jgi:hypothetical protein
MRLTLITSALGLVAISLISVFSNSKVQVRAPSISLEAELHQQEAIQDLPDSFDEGAKQPKSTYNPANDRDILRGLRHASDPLDEALSQRVQREAEALHQALIQRVQSEAVLSVREQPPGSDSGPEVDEYLRFCGVNEAAWWCAAFVSFQIHEAAKDAHVQTNWRKLALCDDIFLWAKKHRLLLDSPVVPSVMLIPADAASPKMYKHVGIVVGYDPARATIETVEGNSNNDRSHNGIGVFRLTRHTGSCMKFVKII